MKNQITKTQSETLDFIISYIDKNGRPPTSTEIGAMFKISRAAAHLRLKSLEARGNIKRTKNISRGIEVVNNNRPESRYVMVPTLKNLNMGEYLFQLDNIEQMIPVSISGDGSPFAFRVKEAFPQHSILAGDILVAQVRNDIEDTSLVIGVQSDEWRVTKASEAGEDFEILGKIVALYRFTEGGTE